MPSGSSWFTVSLDAPTMKLLNGMAAQLSSIQTTLSAMQAQEKKDMSALSDAIATLGTNLSKLQTDMNTAFTNLEAAIASGNKAEIDAAVAALGTANATLQSMDTAALAEIAKFPPA